MHLLPAERSDHRVIDAERICQAIAERQDRVVRYRLASTPVATLLRS